MKKKNLILPVILLATTLMSCGGGNSTKDSEGRNLELTPSGQKIETKSGISKLEKAIQATPKQDVWSFVGSSDSTIDVEGNVKNVTSSGSTSTNFTVSVTEPIIEGHFQKLNGSSISDAKASLKFGGDITLNYGDEGSSSLSKVSGTNTYVAAYLDGTKTYVDPTGAKNFASNLVSAFLDSLAGSVMDIYFGYGYYIDNGFTDEEMPLIPSNIFSDIDNYLSLFSEHADDYAKFLNVYSDNGNYSFYLTLNKNDIITLVSDAQKKAESVISTSLSSVDYATELEDLSVNACEFVVTFNESAILSTKYNIDLTNVTESESYDYDALSSTFVKTGTSTTTYAVKAKGGLTFGNVAPTIPADVKKYVNGSDAFTALLELLEKYLSGDSFFGFDF